MFEQSGGSPRPRRGATGGFESGSAGAARRVRRRTGQLELAGGPSVRLGKVWHHPEPKQLPELVGFALKRPKKCLLKADAAKREAFVAEYAALWHEEHGCGAKIFFADEAHFRADAELRGKWVLRGEPALVDSSSPRYGEKASYYSAVCLETGEVEWMELEGSSNSGTSTAFLEQLREGHTGPLTVIWDKAPAHCGEAVREFLRMPGLGLRLVNLPGYSPDFNADEAVWGWAREEATGNLCLGTKSRVQEMVGNFFVRLTSRNRRSNAAAVPSCNQGPKSRRETPSPVANLW